MASKYIMIPYEKYKRLTETPHQQLAPGTSYNNDSYISNEDGMDNHNNVSLDCSKQQPSKSDILAFIPSNIRHKSSVILSFIERDPLVSWNDKLELVVNGVQIDGTNLVDLLKSVQYRYKHLNPKGRRSFINLLERYNVPKTCMSHKGTCCFKRKVNK